MMRPSLLSILFFLLTLTHHSLAASPWETVTYKGKDYVTVNSIKKFYGFHKKSHSGSRITLERYKSDSSGKNLPGKVGTRIVFTHGGQEVFINNLKFIFSHPIVIKNGKALVSRTDLGKLIDPILRPNYIKEAKPFDTVIIDPGHGGKDPGATNRLGTEAGYNLKVGLLLREDLKRRGFKVIMTRENDRFLSLQERVQLANRYSNAIFISIHFNAGNYRAHGIETFTLSPKGVAHYGRSIKNSDFDIRRGNFQDSANIALASAVHWVSLHALRKKVPGASSLFDRGIRRARFSVLTGVKHPAILFEGGFMSNAKEARLIHSSSYQKTLASAISQAIFNYRKTTTRPQSRRR